MKKYSYLDYKICLSILRAIRLKKGFKMKIETIEDNTPMRINSLAEAGIEEAFLIRGIINDKKDGRYIVFGMLESHSFVMRTKNDEDPDVQDEIANYKNGLWRFNELIKDYRVKRKNVKVQP